MFTHTDQAARPACGHLPRRQATIAGSLGARSVRLGSLSALFSLWGGKAAGTLEAAQSRQGALLPTSYVKTVVM